uniref:Uncharacterized protein n=1 Tax=Paenibacillus athensensis TaxID=1967502 RepID=A0A4Y8Q9H0_9BACL
MSCGCEDEQAIYQERIKLLAKWEMIQEMLESKWNSDSHYLGARSEGEDNVIQPHWQKEEQL